MADAIIELQVIDLSITLSGFQLAEAVKTGLKGTVEKHLQTLIRELDIPADINLNLEFADPQDGVNILPFKVMINGNICRIPLTYRTNSDQDIKSLVAAIMEIIHQNRELFINPDISSLLMGQWTFESDDSSNGTVVDKEKFREIVQAMVSRGFGLRRLNEYLANVATSGAKPPQHFDSLIKISSPSIAAKGSWRYDWPPEWYSQEFREALFNELGVPFPIIKWPIETGLEFDEFQIQLNDTTYPAVSIGAVEKRLDYLKWQLRRHAGSFLTTDIILSKTSALRNTSPILVKTFEETYGERCWPERLTSILRDLVDEGLSIMNLRTILDHLILLKVSNVVEDANRRMVLRVDGPHVVLPKGTNGGDLDTDDCAEYLRSTALKDQISAKFCIRPFLLDVYLLSPKFESEIRTMNGAVTQKRREEIAVTIYGEVGERRNVVLLTPPDIRRLLKRMIAIELPDVAVLSYQEITPALKIKVLGKIDSD